MADYLAENNHSVLLRDIDLEVIRGYVLYLQKRPKNHSHPFMPQYETGLSLVTVENYVRALRAFFNWLYNEGYTAESLLAKLKPPKAPKKLVDPLNNVEITAMFSAIDAHISSGARDVAIITLLLDKGLRSNELVTLQMRVPQGNGQGTEGAHRSFRQLVQEIPAEVPVPLSSRAGLRRRRELLS